MEELWLGWFQVNYVLKKRNFVRVILTNTTTGKRVHLDYSLKYGQYNELKKEYQKGEIVNLYETHDRDSVVNVMGGLNK